MELTAMQIEEVSNAYWTTEASSKDIQARFGLEKPTHLYVRRLDAAVQCEFCGSRMSYTTRTKRDSGQPLCEGCGHEHGRGYGCRCAGCQQRRRHEQELREAEEQRKAQVAYDELVQRTVADTYVGWALEKTSRRDKLFLKAFIDVVSSSTTPCWEDICSRAGVVSHRSYVEKLVALHLLHEAPRGGGVVFNQALRGVNLDVPTVRKVTKGVRFQVFQRDDHKCQYCGRTPPEVELEIDHLMPVAQGGTDDPDNLVTSCRDCNSGKSDKIIAGIRGTSRDLWREHLRLERARIAAERRARVADVEDAWAKCRCGRLSSYDKTAIHQWVERYDPDWIIEAIQIAKDRRPSNYVKYVAGILRNRASGGLTTDALKREANLAQRPATPKQVDYIRSLLGGLGVELCEVYEVEDYDDLTMLDATRLIEELKRQV